MLTSTSSTSPIYRLRPTSRVDSVGDVVTSWDEPARKVIPRARIDDGVGASTTGLVARIEGTAELYIVGAYDLTAADRIEYRGEVWRIDGRPVTRRSLASGAIVEARLTRFEATR